MSQTWRELLEELSSTALDAADPDELDALERDAPGRSGARWLGFPPATPAAIAAREAALGVRLPDDYLAFLAVTNGFRGLAERPYLLCSLLPVEEIGWIGDIDGNGAGGRLDAHAWEDADPEEYLAPADRKRALLIGESDGNECIILLPPREAGGSWETWTYHPEVGFLAGDSFRDFMESAAEM